MGPLFKVVPFILPINIKDNANVHAYAYSSVEGWPTNGGNYVGISDDEVHIP